MHVQALWSSEWLGSDPHAAAEVQRSTAALAEGVLMRYLMHTLYVQRAVRIFSTAA
jgi:hypothetical protein